MEDKISPIGVGEQSAAPQAPRPAPTFLGNTYDVLAIIAGTIAGIIALSCVTLNYGTYCLPVVAVVLGVVAVLKAEASVNPHRTRLWGWISAGVGAAILLIGLALIILFLVFYGAMFSSIFRNTPGGQLPFP